VQGVQEGKGLLPTPLGHVFMATSANFGNMFSMAGRLFLPFSSPSETDPVYQFHRFLEMTSTDDR
jgi:hypothetical protein